MRRGDPLAVPEGAFFLDIEIVDDEGIRRGLRHRDDARDAAVPGLLGDRLQRRRVLEGERADAGAPQRCQVPADAERGAEIAGEGAHVGTRGHLDDDVEVDHGHAVVRARLTHVEHLEAADGDGTRGEGDVLSPTHAGVGALTVDLDRADAARHLLDVAAERGDGRREGLVAQLRARQRRRGRDVALRVVGDRRLAEANRRGVLLVAPDEERQQLRRLVDAEHEHARRHRVERAGVADAARVREAPHAADDVVRGPSGGLVDEDEPVGRLRTRLAAGALLGSGLAHASSAGSAGFLYGSASPA